MIDPVALIVLANEGVVTTADGDTDADRVAVHEFLVDTRTVKVRTDDGDVFVERSDIDHVVDLRTDEYRPRQIGYFFD